MVRQQTTPSLLGPIPNRKGVAVRCSRSMLAVFAGRSVQSCIAACSSRARPGSILAPGRGTCTFPAAPSSSAGSRAATPASMGAPATAGRVLCVFDFDHTIVDANSDTWIVRSAPGEALPAHVKDSYVSGQWTAYMQRVFDYLHQQQVSPDVLRTTLETIPWAPGMQQLMQHLQQPQAAVDCIILSDSNSLFIPWILDSKGYTGLFRQIYTNPAVVTPQGLLSIQPCHSHSCTTCPHNMCKQQLLRDFLQQQQQQQQRQQQQQQQEAAGSQSCDAAAATANLEPAASTAAAAGRPYRHICYVGDGSNDLCPAHLLQPQDALFVRKGYALERLVQPFLNAPKQQQQQQRRASTEQQQQLEEEEQQLPELKQLQAEVHFWDDAADIVAWLDRLQLQ